MYFKTAIAILLTCSTTVAKDEEFKLHRINYEALSSDPLHMENASILIEQLSQQGIVSVTGIPGFRQTKRGLMTHLHACMMDQGDAIPEQIFQDGTVRRTIATVTLPGAGAQPVTYDIGETLSESCQSFNEYLDSFRASVDEATAAFAARLSFEMGSSLPSPLMSTSDGSHVFQDIQEVVASGDHLEHFHSYQKAKVDTRDEGKETIELHTDQGFFISFSPGLVVSHKENNAPDLSQPLVESGGFYVENSNGHRSLIQFSAEDDLIFMMGDGVNQYINNRLDNNATSMQKKLRATPHAVSLTAHEDSLARVWYGRMVLPPKNAYSASTDTTYGDIRKLLVGTPDASLPPGLGCSPMDMRALSGGGDTSACGEDELLCWARCMSKSEFDVSGSTCADQNLQLQCINPRNQFSNGVAHGDYYLACSNTIEAVTPYPKIPAPAGNCAAEWEAFSTDSSYDHRFDLTTTINDGAAFMWSVVDESIKARLAFNNTFGWLSAGLADVGGKNNGMHGANVFMAMPGGNFSAATGLDIDEGSSVKSFVIDPTNSAFRHWQKPFDTNPNAQVVSSECFTELIFDEDHINGIAFNLAGTDQMIWAGNGVDYFVGYHGMNRARFTVEWSTGEAYFGALKKEENTVPTSSSSDRHIALLTASITAVSVVYSLIL